MLKAAGGEVCRIGGDEFMLLKTGEELFSLTYQLSELRSILMSSSGPYPKSFSFAAVNVPAHPKLPLSHYMNVADDKMFEYKRKNKKNLRDLFYKDDRT